MKRVCICVYLSAFFILKQGLELDGFSASGKYKSWKMEKYEHGLLQPTLRVFYCILRNPGG